MKQRRWFAAVIALLVVALPTVAQACPFCNDSQNHSLAQGVYLSILFMLGTIIVVPSILVGAIWWALKKHGPRGLNDTRPRASAAAAIPEPSRAPAPTIVPGPSPAASRPAETPAGESVHV